MPDPIASVLPYSLVVGQEELRTALEIAYVNESVGGVLAAGQRGTAKTTTVRAFTNMIAGELPVTLPIGATDDRVLGGWRIDKLMAGAAEPADGMLVEAAASAARMLYVDEINLLDDYLVNIILDVVSTGILSVQRDHRAEGPREVRFTLVGTMNPDEGGLRPQLLDRFGLVAPVTQLDDVEHRQRIVESVLQFEAERADPNSPFMAEARARDTEQRMRLSQAKARLGTVKRTSDAIAACARLAVGFQLVGHRGELVLIQAAQACAAIEEATEILPDHVRKVAKLALLHRRARGDSGTLPEWTADDDTRVDALILATAD
ncbi:magnesium chelatase subunit I [Actinocrispum wychmicini]|uniref:Magnesium chelatase subunit I n=1 Tax=Actinocrispum wychmicini TaxID=1213861 RepID=A0A4R2JSJ2_9PSEU|nr:magnesium chelatase subunit I [Actinocrispum wychmicini]